MSMSGQRSLPWLNFSLLLAVGVIWGSQFIFQDIALTALSPIWVGVGRTVIGFATLLILCAGLGLRGDRSNLRLYALIGLLEATLPFALIPWGQQYLESSVAAILMGTVPFFAVLFAPFLVAGATLGAGSVASVLLGFSGLLVLFYPQLSTGSVNVSPIGAGAIVVAAASFAVALLLLKRLQHEHPLVVARNVLGMASLQILAFAVIVSPLTSASPSASALGALLYLGVMCAGVVYFLYMTLIRNAGAVFASMTNYLVPAIGVLIGATLNSELVSIYAWIALGMILAAVAMNQLADSRVRSAEA